MVDSKLEIFGSTISQYWFTTRLFDTTTLIGYTESHYKGLVEIYHRFKDSTPVGFNILAFPCNQFGEQE